MEKLPMCTINIKLTFLVNDYEAGDSITSYRTLPEISVLLQDYHLVISL